MKCVPTGSEPGTRGGRERPRGVVLVTVLWVLVLLSLIVTNLSLGGRNFARQTLNTEQGVKARQAADAGIVWAIWSLSQPAPNGSGTGYWLADGSSHEMALGEAQVRVELYDESGKLDINLAPTELLDKLLEPVLEQSQERASLVAAIEDWRDNDDLVRLDGAEEDEYLAAGRTQGPANRPFINLRELSEVLGMTQPVYRYLLPNLTVATRVRTVNPQVAPFRVLMALPNASEAVVQRYIEDRRSAWENSLPVPELPFDAAPYVDTSRAGRDFMVVSEAAIAPYTLIRQGGRLVQRGSTTRLEPEPVYSTQESTAVLQAEEGGDR